MRKERYELRAGGQTVGAIQVLDWRQRGVRIEDHAGAELAAIRTFDDEYSMRLHRPMEEPLRSLVVASAVALQAAIGDETKRAHTWSSAAARRSYGFRCFLRCLTRYAGSDRNRSSSRPRTGLGCASTHGRGRLRPRCRCRRSPSQSFLQPAGWFGASTPYWRGDGAPAQWVRRARRSRQAPSGRVARAG
jgi:hypothetical protein